MLPDAWVLRRKDKDYGVDLEVEVFDDHGRSTGLMFFVQLKATDDITKAQSVPMKVDRLEYLASLDAPSMVVRYCEPNKTFHWLWLPEIYARNAPPKTDTMTIRFKLTDGWDDDTVDGIPETLRTFRTLRTRSRSIPFGFDVHCDPTQSNAAFALNVAVSEIVGISSRFTTNCNPGICLPLRISLKGEILRVSIDSIASISIAIDPSDQDETMQILSYVIACMAHRSNFNEHLHDLADFFAREKLSCESRELASVVASSVVDHCEIAATLASINGIHERQDDNYSRYIHALLSCPAPHEKKLSALQRFYQDAIDAHATRSVREQAVIHYSFGNSLRVAFEYQAALKQYNLARRKYPEYLRKGYFLAELGATLYFLQRYRLSSTIYEAAHAIEASAQTAICAGDAYLFRGQPEKAEEYYNEASNSDNQFEATEGNIKAHAASWLVEFLKQNNHDPNVLLTKPEFWSNVMQQALDGEHYEQAFCASIILSYLLENDPAAWTDAIQISFRLMMEGSEPSILVSTLSCAVQRCGYQAYVHFRGILVNNGSPKDVVHMLDQIAKTLHDDRASVEQPSTVMRLIDPPLFDKALR
ncbi:hypothetical protein AN191_16560 [Loktanella sp. 5RATIMAR09]|nr:hypothetical protein AN191_16560 [Loktanella sp. 5RATIMAR09]